MFFYDVDDEIQLKLITTDLDGEEIFNFVDRSREYLREWLGWVDATKTVSDIQSYQQMMLEKFAKREAVDTAIIYNGKFVGKITLFNIDWHLKKGEIGYYLDEAYQGSGIMTRAAKGMLDIAFRNYGLEKIEISAAVMNHKSRQIPERLGFKHEGTIRQAVKLYDRYEDHAIYGLLATEWLGEIEK